MKYRSIYLLLPMLVIASYAHAAQPVVLPDQGQPALRRPLYRPATVTMEEVYHVRRNNIKLPTLEEEEYQVAHQKMIEDALANHTVENIFAKFMQSNSEIENAVSLSLIGGNLLGNQNEVLQDLTPKVHLLIVALQRQCAHLTQAEGNLKKTAKTLDSKRSSDEFTFYMNTLLTWHREYEMTDEERNQEVDPTEIARKLFTPEQLFLSKETLTLTDEFKKSEFVPEANWGQTNEYTLELNSVPRRPVRVVDEETGEIVFKTDEHGQPVLQEHEGKIPLGAYTDLTVKTYDSWHFTYGRPQDAKRLLEVGVELAQIKEKSREQQDVSAKKKLAEQQKTLREERDKLLESIKGKALAFMTENLAEYTSQGNLLEQKNNLQSLIKGEEQDIESAQTYIASVLFHMTADERSNRTSTKEAIEKLFVAAPETARVFPVTYKDKEKKPKYENIRLKVADIDNRMASQLATTVNAMITLLKNTDDYVIEEQKEEDKGKQEEDSKKKKPTRRSRGKRKK